MDQAERRSSMTSRNNVRFVSLMVCAFLMACGGSASAGDFVNPCPSDELSATVYSSSRTVTVTWVHSPTPVRIEWGDGNTTGKQFGNADCNSPDVDDPQSGTLSEQGTFSHTYQASGSYTISLFEVQEGAGGFNPPDGFITSVMVAVN